MIIFSFFYLEYKNVPAFLKDALPDDITENDVHLFLESRKNSTKLITDVNLDFSLFFFLNPIFVSY